MGRVLGYFGTDVPGDYVVDHGFEWNDNLGRMTQYKGRNLNTYHSHEYRQKHHVPLFKRELARDDAGLLVEWWLTNFQAKPVECQVREAEEQDFVTVIHYNPHNQSLAEQVHHASRQANAASLDVRGRASVYPAGNLPPSGIHQELVLESILPPDGVHARTWDAVESVTLGFAERLAAMQSNL